MSQFKLILDILLPSLNNAHLSFTESLEAQVELLGAAANTNTTQLESNDGQENSLPRPTRQPDQAVSVSSTHHSFNIDAAVKDLASLPTSYFFTLVEAWFREDHCWLPILDHAHVQNCLIDLPNQVFHIPDLVLRAIIALKIEYSSQAICLGYKGRKRLSLHLRSSVLTEAMASPSLDAIRALFVIALLDFGSDNIPSTFNIMSMCRRTGEHIGIFRQLLQRIESQSPQQVGPPSFQSMVADNYHIAITWCVLSWDAVSSLGVSWRDVTAALTDHLSGIAFLTTPDFRDSFVTHVHLTAIGLQPIHEFNYSYGKGEHQDLEGNTMAAVEDIYWNLLTYVHGIPASGYTIMADGAVDFDINHIFTRLLAHATIIMVYQRFILDDTTQNTQLARDRCLESYNQLVDVIRNISDTDTELSSPGFAYFIAQAVRYRLVLEYKSGTAREPVFDILMHGISMCARRWPLARRLDIVLRAAVAEIDTGSMDLPRNFWNLKSSLHDISEELKSWFEARKSTLMVGMLNGPYA